MTMRSTSRPLLRSAACAALVFATGVVAQASTLTPGNTTLPTSFFYSKPLSQAPVLNVSISNGFSQGLVFVAPFGDGNSGPYIYDKFGNLVWDGYGVVGSANAHDFKVCQYHGSDHLCFSQMNQQNGYGIGQAVIVDSNYHVVQTVNTGGNVQPSDMHEFQLLNNGESALLTSYNAIPFDLTSINITSGLGWLLEGAFQEINVTSGAVLFEWFSSQHVDISQTFITPNSFGQSGNGFTPETAFDYFHINSIDKSASGNYLISARHTSTLYYINATDHSIIWQLSYLGQSDFICESFSFSFQHDARLISENATTTVITMFDDASDSVNSTSTQSTGKIIALNHSNGTATLLSEYSFPGKYSSILTTSQGNMQCLSNGNKIIGWGNWPSISEHAENGTALWLAELAPDGSSAVENYRGFSFEWQSTPADTVPDVYAYALNSSSPTHIYVSWNGATTVATWRFYATQEVGQTFDLIGNSTHAGFETLYVASRFYQWCFVEAVGPDGTSLRNSSFQPTFSPGSTLAGACSEAGCAVATAYGSS